MKVLAKQSAPLWAFVAVVAHAFPGFHLLS
jgi:hypothetical protein